MKTSRLFICICTLILYCGYPVQAQQTTKGQHGNLKPEEMTEMHIKEISNRLMLDDDTSKDFMSTYKHYMKDIEQSTSRLDKLKKKYEKQGKGLKDLKDKEIEKLLNEQLKNKEKQLKIQKKYYEKFKQLLTIRQVYKLFEPVFSTRNCQMNEGPVPVEHNDNLRPGRIQEKERLPISL